MTSRRIEQRRHAAKTRYSAQQAERAAARNEAVKAERAARRRGRTPADDGSSAALELIQYARTGPTSEDLAERAIGVLQRFRDSYPGDYDLACAWLVGQLATQAAYACAAWDDAAGGRPAVAWLDSLVEDLAAQIADRKALTDGS